MGEEGEADAGLRRDGAGHPRDAARVRPKASSSAPGPGWSPPGGCRPAPSFWSLPPPDSETTLTEAASRPARLGESACYTCYMSGAICSNTLSGAGGPLMSGSLPRDTPGARTGRGEGSGEDARRLARPGRKHPPGSRASRAPPGSRPSAGSTPTTSRFEAAIEDAGDGARRPSSASGTWEPSARARTGPRRSSAGRASRWSGQLRRLHRPGAGGLPVRVHGSPGQPLRPPLL
jgi:hypothetical protein